MSTPFHITSHHEEQRQSYSSDGEDFMFMTFYSTRYTTVSIFNNIRHCATSKFSLYFNPAKDWVTFYVLLTVHLGIVFVKNQPDAQFFLMYVYFYSLHVSGSHVPIIRRINCINTTSGICHSV